MLNLPIISIPKGGIKEKMKTLRKIRKNEKALSPVVASIILIAVTVAVSIAVAAWMGALTVGFMETKTVTITDATFTVDTLDADIIELSVKNTGTGDVTIASAKINGELCDVAAEASLTIVAGGEDTITVSGANAAWTAGNSYKIDLFDSNGQLAGSYQATA